jgi:hypothetical protein
MLPVMSVRTFPKRRIRPRKGSASNAANGTKAVIPPMRRRHGIDPFACLRDLLTRIPAHPNRRIRERFPDHWKNLTEQAADISG